jgi:hypothetical protein
LEKEYLQDIEDIVDSIYNVNNKLKEIKEKSKNIVNVDLNSLKQKLYNMEKVLQINTKLEMIN